MSIEVTARGIVIPADELSWRFSRSTGPGGQSVNTTDSRAELSFDVAASAVLPPALQGARAARAGGPAGRRRAHRDRGREPLAAAQPRGGRGPDVRAADGGDRAAAPAPAADPAHPRPPASAAWPPSSSGPRSSGCAGRRPTERSTADRPCPAPRTRRDRPVRRRARPSPPRALAELPALGRRRGAVPARRWTPTRPGCAWRSGRARAS